MPNYNKLILIGHLVRDPELKFLPSNTAVCECGIAVNHSWKDRDGNKKEEVLFLDFALFGKTGEAFNQYMAKGRAVLIEGRLRLESWTDKDGGKRSKHKMAVESWSFMGESKGQSDRPREPERQPQPPSVAPPSGRPAAGEAYEPPRAEDIPY